MYDFKGRFSELKWNRKTMIPAVLALIFAVIWISALPPSFDFTKTAKYFYYNDKISGSLIKETRYFKKKDVDGIAVENQVVDLLNRWVLGPESTYKSGGMPVYLKFKAALIHDRVLYLTLNRKWFDLVPQDKRNVLVPLSKTVSENYPDIRFMHVSSGVIGKDVRPPSLKNPVDLTVKKNK